MYIIKYSNGLEEDKFKINRLINIVFFNTFFYRYNALHILLYTYNVGYGDCIMSILIDIIAEEKERLEELLKFYRDEISKYPKGYISKRKRNGNVYCYRSYRDGDTVKTVYIGISGSDDVKELEKTIEKRHDFEKKYQQAKMNLKEAKGLLRGKK